jgi:hypothetical protein
MPKAYSLLVGLTEVDSGSAYYRSKMPGFDGRSGCEGCGKDVRRMSTLTHYLGLEGVTEKPLLNERATRANVLAALTTLSQPGILSPGDFVFLYISSHGRTHGEAPKTRSNSAIGNSVNSFLVWDRPLFNFEILERLIQIPVGVRIFSMIDACHAGLGTAMELDLGSFASLSAKETVKRIQSNPVLRERAAQTQLFKDISVLGFPYDAPPSTSAPAADPGSTAGLKATNRKLLNLLASNIAGIANRIPAATVGPEIVHYGAARDEARAYGDENGSLFSNLFHAFYNQSGNELNYHRFFLELEAVVPGRHPPTLEYIPIDPNQETRPNLIPPPAKDHFGSRQHPLQLL